MLFVLHFVEILDFVHLWIFKNPIGKKLLNINSDFFSQSSLSGDSTEADGASLVAQW